MRIVIRESGGIDNLNSLYYNEFEELKSSN